MHNKGKLRIAFIWYWERASERLPNWRDGHRAALEEIAKVHDVSWFYDKTTPDPGNEYDFILFWDDSNSEFFKHLDYYGGRKGICLTTDPHNIENLKNLDVVFCESQPIYEAVRQQGKRAIKAFGTDTDFYTPGNKERDIEYFYPATFSPWKQQRKISYLGEKLLCVGTVQPDGLDEYNSCLASKVKCEVGYFPAATIRDYYQRTQKMIIPAIHGSERTVLEAMASGIFPEVNEKNIKARSYLEELEQSGLEPREFVEKNYSHHVFAKNLLKGIENV